MDKGKGKGRAPDGPQITQLPAEILHNVLRWLEPRDLGVVPKTCRFMNNFIRSDLQLWKDMYLQHMDTPRKPDLDWEQEIRDVVRLELICATPCQRDSKRDAELMFVYHTVTRLLRHASPAGGTAMKNVPSSSASRNASFLNHLFREEKARSAFLTRSFIFERSRNSHTWKTYPDPPNECHWASAHLHCLYGRPILNSTRTRSGRVQPYALSKVYDLRQYTQRTHWGPFMDDGSDRVDWEKVEAIMIVLGSNIRQVSINSPAFYSMWDAPFVGSWSNSWLPTPKREIKDLDLEDPYGISGTWLRVVCFIDYNDFFRYNFITTNHMGPDRPRPAIDVGEATRLIIMKLHVTSIHAPGEEDGQDLPVVHFEGISRSLHHSWDNNANSDLRGTCRLTRDGEVRWTTFSIFDGEERWRSESVQVGGVNASRGVLGNWFDVNYDEHGPAGPTAFWKMSDPRTPRENDNEVLIHDFLPIVDGFDLDFSTDEENDGDFIMGEYGEDDEEEDIDEDDEREAMERDLEALAAADMDIIDYTVEIIGGGMNDMGHSPGPGPGPEPEPSPPGNHQGPNP